MKAKWGLDYDYRTDRCFNRPMCAKCDAPIVKDEKGKYFCVSCRKRATVTDPEMLKWLTDREGIKVEIHDCAMCGGKQCLESHLVRNKVTLEWETAGGRCRNCGMRFIV